MSNYGRKLLAAGLTAQKSAFHLHLLQPEPADQKQIFD